MNTLELQNLIVSFTGPKDTYKENHYSIFDSLGIVYPRSYPNGTILRCSLCYSHLFRIFIGTSVDGLFYGAQFKCIKYKSNLHTNIQLRCSHNDENMKFVRDFIDNCCDTHGYQKILTIKKSIWT